MFKKEAIPYIFLFVFLSIPIYPQNDTMDVIGWQWVLMAILNLGLFIYTYFSIGISKPKGFELKILLGLFSVMCISILYATNMSLAIQDTSRWLQIIIMIWLFGLHFKTKVISYNNVAKICLVFLFIEVNVVLTPLYLELFLNGLSMLNAVSIDSNVFNGITGNKNIAAASIAVKLPFILYLLNSHKMLWRILSVVTGMLSVISILFIAARASYISLVCIIICASLYGLFYNKSRKTYYTYLILSIGSGLLIGYILLPNASSSAMANKVASISFTEKGSSGRNFLWRDAINFGLEHPLTGGGIGSWKIESAPYWNAHGSEYLVPYHAHNDFLELFAELGVIGLILYLLLFLIMGYRFIKKGMLNLTQKNSFYYFTTLSLGAYFVDSVFNFPMERTIMMLSFALLIILSQNSTIEKYEK